MTIFESLKPRKINFTSVYLTSRSKLVKNSDISLTTLSVVELAKKKSQVFMPPWKINGSTAIKMTGK